MFYMGTFFLWKQLRAKLTQMANAPMCEWFRVFFEVVRADFLPL